MSSAAASKPVLPQHENSFLSGNYAPVADELSLPNLPIVAGKVPEDLDGIFIRNGPNPQFTPIENYHWFEGDGMLHACRVSGGNVSYVNKFVVSQDYLFEKSQGQAYFYSVLDILAHKLAFVPSLIFQTLKSKLGFGPSRWGKAHQANTALVFHDKKFMALMEADVPYVIKLPNLETVGRYDYKGTLKHPMTAHPKIDPQTGEMFFFAYSPVFKPYLVYSWVNAAGEVQPTIPIDIPFPSMMHDFVVTKNYAIFPHFPFHVGTNVGFDANGKTRWGFLPRYAKDVSELIWIETGPVYAFHFANAHEEGEEIVVYGCPRSELSLVKLRTTQGCKYWFTRWTFNLKTKQAKEEHLLECVAEFPTIRNSLSMSNLRYTYMASNTNSVPTEGGGFSGTVKYDLHNQTFVRLEMPEGYRNEEMSFAAKKNGTDEDDGYLTGFVFDSNNNSSEFWIVDAKTLKVLARLAVPRRVPFGFHGLWVDSSVMATQDVDQLKLPN